jgi:ABC-type bacteriocin/lantibiotic exporter with double-glycine peptidase domain
VKRAIGTLLVPLALSFTQVGCHLGSLRTGVTPTRSVDSGWLLVPGVPLVTQRERADCGAAALAMVLQYWGLAVTRDQITAAHPPAGDDRRGLRAGELRDFSRARGLQAFVVEGGLDDISSELQRARPVIVGLGKPYGSERYAHYEVVVGLHRARRRILTLDPARGWRENSLEGFAAEWAPARRILLVVFRMAGR